MSLRKIPVLTLLFWVTKICATTLGETAGDLLTKTPEQHGLGCGTEGASLILFGLLVALVLYETFSRRQAPPAAARA